LVVPLKKVQIRTYKKGYLAQLVVLTDNLVKKNMSSFFFSGLWLSLAMG
jgi:hypothetical protein